MDCIFSSITAYPIIPLKEKPAKSSSITTMAYPNSYRKLPKNLRYPRRTKLPPDFGVNLFLQKPGTDTATDTQQIDSISVRNNDSEEEDEGNNVVWESDEVEAISSLFRGRIPQKPGKLGRERPLPLPLPYKLRPSGFPTPKKHVKLATSRSSVSKQLYKNPNFLIGLARKIKDLAFDEDVSAVLNRWAPFLRKGSLSMTIRELGHMGLPQRALQTFCWAQEQPQLFPDDRILSSTVEVLARNRELKVPVDLEKFTSLTNRSLIEAMVKGFIKGGSLNVAWKLFSLAKQSKRMLDPSIYAKLMLELGKNPDKHILVVDLLDDLGVRDDLNLSQLDCTAIMKVCIRLGKFEIVESLFNWFKQSGRDPSVVMYTTLLHSRYSEKKYREALALVWEMEASECVFDLPAYRVAIKVLVALNDLSRAVRYFSKLKEAGFSPTYDIYRDLISIYMVSGRLAKCKEVCKEAEMGGFSLDKHTLLQLSQLEKEMSQGETSFAFESTWRPGESS
ncbi:pentatricopeptide repeat-containing protein At2g01860 isoform X2 [Durio zibethinus]|uniref:Pentatricopeptide repeat-containing protein At2g01860 isoform X2 n=1 Tax=Durio zibethinus TaxID=66656 RepID=A0A6P5YPJ1_DURZI|nr:pentatricopeptide repeat-containing protein At2g01860 isoform X2 [Durio zibethinus]